MSLEKRPVKAVIEHAMLPQRFESLTPAAQDLQAAAHIRNLEFGQIEEPQLTFAAVEPGPEPRV
jgi:hypothetical protein